MIQGQDGWGVTYSSTEICALKGSTVEINCTYTHPSGKHGHNTEVKKTFWFTKLSGSQPVDLRTDSDYQDRVEYSCSEKSCSLRIRDLRESDSAEYKFRFITNQPDGRYTGSPGVTLRVTGNIFIRILIPNVQILGNIIFVYLFACIQLMILTCPDFQVQVKVSSLYIWHNNGQKMDEETSSHPASVNDNGSYSCAFRRQGDYSPPECEFTSHRH